jgi:hypothetical protein
MVPPHVLLALTRRLLEMGESEQIVPPTSMRD